MDDLEQIRARRMAEMKSQFGGGDPSEQAKQAQQQQQRKEEMVNQILSQILDQSARGRLNSIALVKPDKAKQIEAMLVRMAQGGQISDKMSEPQLVQLLEKVNMTQSSKTTVKFDRRRVMDSDSDDDY
jgi:programmed cell death protein 5